MSNKLKAGDLAYIDTFSGLIPCKILNDLVSTYRAKITANRSAWKKGEIVKYRKSVFIARNQVHIRDGQYRIKLD